MITLIFGALVALQVQSTVSFENCKKSNFEGKQCAYTKSVVKLGKKLEKVK